MDELNKMLGLGESEPEDEEMKNKYRRVFFGTHEGVEVLDDILRTCHYYDTLPTDNPAVIAMHNVAKVILNMMDMVRGDTTVEMLKQMNVLSSVRTTRTQLK